MMNGLLLDDNTSNLTSGSNEGATISSGNRNEVGANLYPQQQSFANPNQPPPAKKKRNLPGNPDPEAEVVHLSPKTLMATNRFICEICNKGFQRDQNLQLHRRGHNLPWKLKQRANKDQVRKKVYVCPEPTCVHHDPSRALGDLTGIKKHFSRKHGEKKWKCEKCSKRYAVQSDWKAHSKICGTREYRCDCGTLFSRRDSFITHRAFCDALAEESTRANMSNPTQPNPLLSSNSPFALHSFPLKTELQDTHLPSNSHFALPPWVNNSNSPNIDLSSQLLSQSPSPHMSATALLQKAAQMGAAVSKPHQAHGADTVTAGTGLLFSTGFSASTSSNGIAGDMVMPMREGLLASFLGKANTTSGSMENVGATSYEMGGNLPSFEEAFGGILNQKMGGGDFTESLFPKTVLENGLDRGQDQSLTRDFLGLRAMPHGGFANMAGLNHQISSSSSYNQHTQNQGQWQG